MKSKPNFDCARIPLNLDPARGELQGHPTRSNGMRRSYGSGYVTMSLAAFWSFAAMADEPQMPKSLDEAISMERADALPRTALYDAPALDASKPGDLLRQEASVSY